MSECTALTVEPVWIVLQALAFMMAMGGNFLVTSLAPRVRLKGFAVWITGNCIWLVWTATSGQWILFLQYCGFQGWAILGVIRNYRGRKDTQEHINIIPEKSII